MKSQSDISISNMTARTSSLEPSNSVIISIALSIFMERLVLILDLSAANAFINYSFASVFGMIDSFYFVIKFVKD